MSSEPPDVLVLGGGGILGEAWMSAVLAGINSGGSFDARRCRSFVGTSAGSIVAASLAAGVDPGAQQGGPAAGESIPEAEPPPGGRLGPLGVARNVGLGLSGSAAAALAALTLGSTAGVGASLRRRALTRVPMGRRSLGGLGESVADSGACFDGRLRLATVDLQRGSRVMFGAPGAPAAAVAAAVQASCAIPGVFRPVRIGGRTYVDGGVWSPTNMDAADVVQGDRVLCLNPTESLRPTLGAPAGALGHVSRAIAAAEALALRHRGARVRTIAPDAAATSAMGANFMDAGRRSGVAAAGLAQGLRLAGTGTL